MQTWEYMFQVLELKNLEEDNKQLNELGDSGWEVVSVLSRKPRSTDLLILLKRPKSSA